MKHPTTGTKAGAGAVEREAWQGARNSADTRRSVQPRTPERIALSLLTRLPPVMRPAVWRLYEGLRRDRERAQRDRP